MNTERQLLLISALLHDLGIIRGPGSYTSMDSFSASIKEKLDEINCLKAYSGEIIEAFQGHLLARSIELVAGNGVSSNESGGRLKSIFASLSLTKNIKSASNWCYQPLPIGISEEKESSFFPEKKMTKIGSEKTLGDLFWEEHKLLRASANLNAYATSLFHLLAKYSSRISPSHAYPTQDVSLYDHSRLVAGTVNCLSLPGQSLADPKFVFLIGDLSGLQKFIYSNIDPSEAGDGKGLAKRLRGRSYYIALLTDMIAERLTEVFEVNEANILYSGGGGFQLLLPKTGDYEKKIRRFTEEINSFLFEKIEGRIGLITGYTEVDQDIFQHSTKYVQAAYDHLGRQKARKFEDNLEYLFYTRPTEKQPSFNDDTNLGKIIPYGKILVEVAASDLRIKQEEPQASMARLGLYYFVLDERKKRSDITLEVKSLIKQYRDQAQYFRILSINETDFLAISADLMQSFPDVDIRAGFRFIGSYAPQHTVNGNQAVMEYTDIAELNYLETDGKKKLTYPKLAVMRLDVDNLGALFGLGLGEQASFARVATLSRELHLFFSGYFNQIARKYQLYVTYSGGDDAFVVGSWLNVMHAAKELRKDFQRFTCDNTELSFSAGIFMCSEYYPVAKFAHQAEEAEKKAKQFKKGAKDAVCVFDHTLSWSQYFEMLDFAETILKYVEVTDEEKKGKLSRSLIHRILQVVKTCISEDGQLIPNRLYRQTARLHYLFARQTRKEGSGGFNHAFIEKTKTKFATGGEEMKGSLDEQIAHHVIRIFLDHFSHNGDKKGLVANLIVPTSYVTYKTRTLEN